MTPLVLLAAYATGISLVRFFAPWDLTGHAMIIGVLLVSWLLTCRSRLAWIPTLGLLLFSGFLQAALNLEPPSTTNHISSFVSNSPLILQGRLLTVEKRATGGYRLRTEMLKVVSDEGTAEVTGELLLYIKHGALSISPGQIVRWRSPLRRPATFGNPGEFDYPLFLAARGIYVTAFLKNAEELVVLVNSPEKQRATVENLRHMLATRIEQTVPEDAAGLVEALLLGMKGRISTEQRQTLVAGGVSHLFAISGLHFGLLALLMYQAGKWFYTRSHRLTLLCPPQRVLPILLIIPLAAYLFLTGNAWSTRRAFLMVSVVTLLLLRGRRTPPFTLLATIALIILLDNPLALFQPGFQLSFAGVAGILAWLPLWRKPLARRNMIVRLPMTLVLTTLAATLATLPASIWHFHLFSPAVILTNLVAIPLIAWGAVPAGLAGLALTPFSTLLSKWGLLTCAKLVIFATDIVNCISQWPMLSVIPLYLTASRLILLLGILLFLLPLGKNEKRWPRRTLVVLTTIVAAVLTQADVAEFQVTALSVGQGDATLVSLADDAHYLIDGGGLPNSSIDPGERLVAPALGRMGIDHLDGVILTHNHPDHSSGLVHILNRFPVEAFYHAGESSDIPPDLLSVLRQRNIALYRLNDGWTHLLNKGDQSFSLFAPVQTEHDENENSVAVFAGWRDDGVLLTADLGEKGLQQLIEAGLPGRATLLKLPHHGSRLARPQSYLDWTQPAVAFVSAGVGNPYNFPHEQTIKACDAREVPLFRTDLQGMLIFRLVDGQWHAKTEKAL